MVMTNLPQYDDTVEITLETVIQKEDQILEDITEEHLNTREKIDDYGLVTNSIKNDTYALLGKGVIKSIQRGLVSIPNSTSETNNSKITINSVDINKSILLFSSSNVSASTRTYQGSAAAAGEMYGSQQGVTMGNLTDSNTLTIRAKGLIASGTNSGGGSSGFRSYQYTEIAWQVIEFY